MKKIGPPKEQQQRGSFVNFPFFPFHLRHSVVRCRLIDGQLRILNASVYTSRILKHQQTMNSDSDSLGRALIFSLSLCQCAYIYHRQEIYICDLWASLVLLQERIQPRVASSLWCMEILRSEKWEYMWAIVCDLLVQHREAPSLIYFDLNWLTRNLRIWENTSKCQQLITICFQLFFYRA